MTEQLRAAIIDFENVELTPEKTVARLREENYGDDAIAFFLSRLGDTSKLNAKEVWPAITRAWLDTIARDQQIREPRLHPHLPEEESLKSLLRRWVFGHEKGKLTAAQLAEMQQYKLREGASYLPFDKLNYLFGPGQPMKFSRDNYFLDRNLMVAKKGLWIEPKPFVKPPVLESEKRDKAKKDAEDAGKAIERAQHKARLAEQRQHDEAKAKASAAAEKEALAKKAEEEKINSEKQKRIAAVEEERNIAHKQERPAGAFGRDIVKVQLGMPIEQADAIIRQQMKVAAVVELKPGTWGYTPTLLWRRIYASSNGTELIALYTLPQAGNRIVGVSRRLALPLPGLTKEEASKLLTDKYGPPSASYDRGYGDDLYWTDNPEALGRACREIDVVSQTHGYVYTEGKLDEMRSYWGHSRDAENHVLPDGIGMTGDAMLSALLSRDVRSCPTTLVAMLSPDAKDPALRLTLVGGGWVAGLIEAERQSKSGANVETVKSLLNGAN